MSVSGQRLDCSIPSISRMSLDPTFRQGVCVINCAETLLVGLKRVCNTDQFEDWVRLSLRPSLQHAALLCTLGKLYGVGSVPTHRISVDYPLTMIEALKNCAGALDDPLMYGWFRTERLRCINLETVNEFGGQQQWRRTLSRYGVRSMMIHGVLDHRARRFAVFQLCNPHGGASQENIQLISLLIRAMSDAAWATVDMRLDPSSRCVIGHPTVSLTATELHIVELLAQGLSNKEIARRRGVSDSTVKTQVQRTGAKLGATRRSEIVAIAMPMLSPLPAQNLVDYGDETRGIVD